MNGSIKALHYFITPLSLSSRRKRKVSVKRTKKLPCFSFLFFILEQLEKLVEAKLPTFSITRFSIEKRKESGSMLV